MKMTNVDAAKALAAEAASAMLEGGPPLELLLEFATAQGLHGMGEDAARKVLATWTDGYFLGEGVLQSVVNLKGGERVVVRGCGVVVWWCGGVVVWWCGAHYRSRPTLINDLTFDQHHLSPPSATQPARAAGSSWARWCPSA